jgi:arylsulfatase
MTDKAISWVRQQKSLMPDRPFFAYFAPGATHAPHHVPKDWIDRYRGRFDAGWDALREENFARQKALGVIPADAELTARPVEIPAWDDMADELKPVLARQMEVYAAFLAHTDHHIGRLIDAIDGLGVLEDTLVYYIIGDNGASAEGGINGTFNETFAFNGDSSRLPSSCRRRSTSSRPRPTTTSPSVGRVAADTPSSDKAGRLALGGTRTERLCTGRTASPPAES